MVTPTSAQSSGTTSSQSSRTDEWSAARSTIERFDGYLNDLRKYGFGLVTTLLAVTGYLSASPDTRLPDPTKLVVTIAILGLVVTLSFLDGQYRSLQRGAIVRARILERSLNLDLTTAISHYTQIDRFRWTYLVIYSGVGASTTIVGVGVLWGNVPMEWILILAFAVTLGLIWYLGGDSLIGIVDWSVDSKVVHLGDRVRVTFTNLQDMPENAYILAGCEVQGDDEPDYKMAVTYQLTTARFMSQADWTWKTDDPPAKAGLYRIIGCWHQANSDGTPVGDVDGAQSVEPMPKLWPRPTWITMPGKYFDREVNRYVRFKDQHIFQKKVDTKGFYPDDWPSFAMTVQLVGPAVPAGSPEPPKSSTAAPTGSRRPPKSSGESQTV